MKKILVRYLSVLVGFLVFPVVSFAANEYATFDSFYREPLTVAWVFVVGGALVAGVMLVFTGGAASPAVVAMGTWAGELMGLSGAAATNAGLALIGGGAISNGGFGMLGGAALLTTALSFGTGAAIDVSAGTAVESYGYARFVEDSRKMVTYPLPRNSTGSPAFEKATKILVDFDDMDVCSRENLNGKIADNAKQVVVDDQRSRSQTLLSLLDFVCGDYSAAKNHSLKAYSLAKKAKVRATLPASIYASSLLYDKNVDERQSLRFFEESVIGEADSVLTPLVFSIYLDRLSYRFVDSVSPSYSLDRVYGISSRLPYNKRRALIQAGLVNRYIVAVYSEKMRILTLTGSSNDSIKGSDKTLESVRRSLHEYNRLVMLANGAVDRQVAFLTDKKSRAKTYGGMFTRHGLESWEERRLSELPAIRKRLRAYAAERQVLAAKVSGFEKSFRSVAEMSSKNVFVAPEG